MSTTVEVRAVRLDDPVAEPLVHELTHEYVSRYGPGGHEEMARHPPEEFAPPGGLLLLLLERGEPVAGGAYRRHGDPGTAEVKRMWTHSAHRRRGLARRVLAELERAATAEGYRRILLTTGSRQPEARQLYLAAGYTPLFDLDAPPGALHPLPFEKHLTDRRPAAAEPREAPEP
ncbi:GNAT family N-acetyltransferase [Kitasatospora sp. NPDC007106]|uniref:GNAT family N-acetyltransferase n=1 Tax=Kitasatospora sp. NPDC007106 TaxID=3156914 RepID=UPI0034097481